MDEDETEEITNIVGGQQKFSAICTAATKVTSSKASQQQIRIQGTSAQQQSIRSTLKTKTSKQYLSKSAQSSIAEEDDSMLFMGIPQCQIITQEASGDSDSGGEENGRKIVQTLSASASQQKITKHRFQILSKSAQNSSSSQEEYEPDVKFLNTLTPSSGKSVQSNNSTTSNQFLSAAQARVETAKSMESLRTTSTSAATTHHRSSFLTSSERDMRRITSASVEGRSLEYLEREARMKRRAISGEEIGLGLTSHEESITAERRRGLFASGLTDRRTVVPQHLSLPPPGGMYNTLSPGERRLTILSPHSPHHTPDLLQFSQTSFTTLKTRRKKAIVLPRLVLPRSDSEVSSDVFLEHDLS